MAVTGIIAEFNPFHKGHKFLLNQAEGLKIIAMSGNFVQRGEPAVVDKWTRTQMALEAGADLVVELPFSVSVQAADFFAQGAVEMLDQLGIDCLTFGTEEMLDYQALARLYEDRQEEMAAYLAELPASLSYPQKTQAMWQTFAGLDFSGSTPNHILGLAYAKAAAGRQIALRPIQRQGAGYHSLAVDHAFVSATALRQHLDQPDFLTRFAQSPQLLQAAPKVTWQELFPYLCYQILTSPDLTVFYQVNEELAVRIEQAVKKSRTIEELVEQVATKRYTKARVRRILTYILVGAEEAELPQGIHILGFSQAGRQYLSSVKHQTSLISRIGKEPWDSLTQQADRVYQLANHQLSEQNIGRVPLMAF
ncbi:UPF0348 protein family [Streptococcus sp. DD11]|uniref:nucleotidyltransferase n=1 Tax=Streptococcus sp. DD11 TaxID=1777879 RepID=UPI0007914FE5|nr:nucleotidyltransferase [Streptococcus sp. DD11]KXT86008.1 UPF0348 protein family [Streptococcus sp. DD11]